MPPQQLRKDIPINFSYLSRVSRALLHKHPWAAQLTTKNESPEKTRRTQSVLKRRSHAEHGNENSQKSKFQVEKTISISIAISNRAGRGASWTAFPRRAWERK